MSNNGYEYIEGMPKAPVTGLSSVPVDAKSLLQIADERFLAMHGIFEGFVTMKQSLKDRTNFFHYYEPFSAGNSLPDMENRVHFIHEITGVAKAICSTWLYFKNLDWLGQGRITVNHDGEILSIVRGYYQMALDFNQGVRA